jgi:putative spermidine/putrescine transport system ATP-binding protein
MSYIRFDSINNYFGALHVLKDISIEVEKGHMVTLLGPSGCGKSTLLRSLAGLEEVSGGRIYLDGEDITDTPPKERGIGMVFQQYSLFPNMTAAQNVAFGLTIKKLPKPDIDKKVKDMLEVVGLSDQSEKYPSQMSGGQQQRVALARAIITNPKVLLLDEPLSAIDAKLRRSLQIEIRRIQREFGMTTIFVTHDQDEAMVMSDRIHLFNAGRIEQSGTPTELYTQPKSKFAAGFIGSYNILTADELEKASGQRPLAQDVAIRPEIVRVNTGSNDPENRYEFKGKVVNSLSHGNIIRYSLDCNGVLINADLMFEYTTLLKQGEEVGVSINKHNVIGLSA